MSQKTHYISAIALIVWLFTIVPLSAQQCVAPPLPGESCLTAPLYSCNLDGLVSNTGSYSATNQPFGFCGIVENNQYLSFIADENIVILEITPDFCNNSQGLQAVLYHSTDCSTLNPVSNCASDGFQGTLTITANPVTIGERYYLMVDGFEGDFCDFTINVVRGILPDVEAQAPDASLCLGNSIQLDGTNSTISPSSLYEWTATNGGNILSGANTLTPTVDQLGDYTLSIIDTISCCKDEVTISVTENTNFPNIDLSVISPINCTNTYLTIDGTGSSVGDFTYQWTTTDGNIFSASNILEATVDEPGTYTLTVINNQIGCSSTESIDIALDTITPDIAIDFTGTVTCSTPAITLNSITGTQNLTYDWSGPNGFTSSLANPYATVGGGYVLTVTGENGCTNTASVNIDQDNSEPDVSASVMDMLNCINQNITIQGSSTTPNVTYNWGGPNGFTSTAASPSVDETGTYYLLVTAPNGCTTSDFVQVMDDFDTPNISSQVSDILSCTNSSVNLIGNSLTNGAAYEWTGPNGFQDSQASPSTNEVGTYTLTITGPNGCTAQESVVVSQDLSVPIADAGTNQNLNCLVNQVNIGSTNSSTGANFSYEWRDDMGNIVANTSTTSISSAGTYSLVVTNTTSSCSSTSSVQVLENIAPPNIDGGAAQTLTCTNNQVTLDGSSTDDVTFEWRNSSGMLISSDEDATVTNAGTYQLIATHNITGCTSESFVVVDHDITLPVAQTASSDVLTCTTQSIDLSGAGSSTGANFIYEWTDANGNNLGTAIDQSINAAGTYEMMVTNTTNGCTAVSSITAIQNGSVPVADAVAPDSLTCIENRVSLDGSASSVGSNYTYEWTDVNGNSIDNTINTEVTAIGIYNLLVTDTDNGCTSTTSVEVFNDVNSPISNAGATQTLTCALDEITLDGRLSSTGDNYTYEWTDATGNVVGNRITNLVQTPDTYTLIVTDATNGCTTSSEVTVNQEITPPIADAGADVVLDCNNTTINLDASNSSTGNNFTYDWINSDQDTFSQNMIQETDTPGNYSLVVTDTNTGCTATTQLVVLENQKAPLVHNSKVDTLTCKDSEVEINIQATSLNGTDFSYQWENLSGNLLGSNSNLMVSESGIYEVLVTDLANGCTTLASIEVDENIEAPEVDAGDNMIITCDQTIVTLNGTESPSRGDDFSYQWLNNQGSVVNSNLSFQTQVTGNYTLIITNDNNGCTSMDEMQVTDNKVNPIADAGPDDEITCTKKKILLDGSNSTAQGNISFRWEDATQNQLGAEEFVEVETPGEYILFVKDEDNGCEAQSKVMVEEDTDYPEFTLNEPLIINCINENTTLESTILSGTNLQFDWQNELGNTLSNQSELIVEEGGIYNLMITNSTNGCQTEKNVEVLFDKELPLADAGPDVTLTCNNPRLEWEGGTSSVGAIYDYQWLDNQGATISTDLDYIIENTGSYTLQVQNTTNGCINNDEVIIQENKELPNALIETDALAITCATDKIILDGSNSTSTSDFALSWFNTNGINISDDNQIEINQEGTYGLEILNIENGCTDSTEISITMDIEKPDLKLEPAEILTCLVNEIQLKGTMSNAGDFEFNWTTSNGNIVGNANNLTTTVDEGGAYILMVINKGNGCTSIESLEVVADQELPEVAATALSELDCITETVTLSGEGSTTGLDYEYEWTGGNILFGNTTLNPEVDRAGTYTLTVRDTKNGCTATQAVEVEENTDKPTSAVIDVNDPNCYGERNGSVIIANIEGGTEPYLVSFDEGILNSETRYEFLESGTYNMLIQDATGCEWDTTLVIQTAEDIEVELGPDQTISLGQSVEIDALVSGTADIVDWTATTYDMNETDLSIEVYPVETTTYTITVINENGCESTDYITIVLDREKEVFIPNVFSPNGDGINDMFKIYAGPGVERVNSLLIFDRWGEQLFEQHNFDPDDLESGWDGYFRAQKMQQGVYVYVTEILFIDGSVEFFKGDVTIK